MSFEYHTEGTCARNIILEMDGDIIKNVQFIGGCNGNLKGISALIRGQKAQDVIERVKGIQCGPKSTSVQISWLMHWRHISARDNLTKILLSHKAELGQNPQQEERSSDMTPFVF